MFPVSDKSLAARECASSHHLLVAPDIFQRPCCSVAIDWRSPQGPGRALRWSNHVVDQQTLEELIQTTEADLRPPDYRLNPAFWRMTFDILDKGRETIGAATLPPASAPVKKNA